MPALLTFTLLSLVATTAAAQTVERQVIATVSGPDLDSGILSELAWDGGTLIIQSVVANPDGSLSGRYLGVPGPGVTLTHLPSHTDASEAYWTFKSQRRSPTGLGEIVTGKDAKMPMYGIGSQEQRFADAVDMGGTQSRLTLRLGRLILQDREDGREPYDGQFWSWSPVELNRIAYVDAKGDLWVARADGSHPARLLKGSFMLPAWSEDGRSIAVADHKDDDHWEIVLVRLPESLRTPERN